MFQSDTAELSVCVRINELTLMHYDDVAEKAIFLSREDKGESEKLSAPSSSSVATKLASVAHSSHYKGPSALPENAAAHSLHIGATAITNKSKRPSKIELAATLRKIRHLLAEGYTNKDIIEILQIEERTFYRYMKRIYAQDQAYFEKLDNEAIATEIRLAKERTLKSLRRYDAIAADESLSAVERIEAERCRGDIVIALAKIEIEGPRIVYDTFRRVNGQLQEKTTTAKLNNNNRVL
jgi:DNA-binding CsgD family transcriptional regulator